MRNDWYVRTFDDEIIRTDDKGAFEASKAMEDKSPWKHGSRIIAGSAIRSVERPEKRQPQLPGPVGEPVVVTEKTEFGYETEVVQRNADGSIKYQ